MAVLSMPYSGNGCLSGFTLRKDKNLCHLVFQPRPLRYSRIVQMGLKDLLASLAAFTSPLTRSLRKNTSRITRRYGLEVSDTRKG
jgi:hypothetical protein